MTHLLSLILKNYYHCIILIFLGSFSFHESHYSEKTKIISLLSLFLPRLHFLGCVEKEFFALWKLNYVYREALRGIFLGDGRECWEGIYVLLSGAYEVEYVVTRFADVVEYMDLTVSLFIQNF